MGTDGEDEDETVLAVKFKIGKVRRRSYGSSEGLREASSPFRDGDGRGMGRRDRAKEGSGERRLGIGDKSR
jgi:hypothetical protein